MEFKIDKDVPQPRVSPFQRKYPFNEMKPGDSFHIPFEWLAENYPGATKNTDYGTRLAPTISYWAKRSGTKFSYRTLNDGIRVWRVK